MFQILKVFLTHIITNHHIELDSILLKRLINSDQEPELNDNAKGFTNYAAPGADRLKIRLNLAAKKLLTDTEDTSFVEIFSKS